MIVSYVFVFKTPIGLRIRACGEHPRAADTSGSTSTRFATRCVVLSGMLAALGGAYLSIGYGGGTLHRQHDRGPRLHRARGADLRELAAVRRLLRGAALRLLDRARLPAAVYSASAATLFQALPYVLTLVAVAGVIGRTVPPAADGRPYVRQ